MNFSPIDRREILAQAAKIVAEELLREIDPSEITVLPLATAAKLAGISARHARRIFPLVTLSPRAFGVTLSDYQAVIHARKSEAEKQATPCP